MVMEAMTSIMPRAAPPAMRPMVRVSPDDPKVRVLSSIGGLVAMGASLAECDVLVSSNGASIVSVEA